VRHQLSFFDADRLRLEGAIDISLGSLREYGQRYKHWAIAFSGGKDSTATVALVAWAVISGEVEAPSSLTILYADTRMEFPPLQRSALNLLGDLSGMFVTKVVLPSLDRRFFVYMLGRGVPPPKNRFRWCTPMLKVEPMMMALKKLRKDAGEKILMLTGVRLGESEVRDQRIALSCSRDDGECGQGWYQIATDEAVADTLAPLLHWRLCHVYDWIYLYKDVHGFNTSDIAVIYGEDEIRTGCVGCNLASKDTALNRLLRNDEWQHLRPLKELKPLYQELAKPKWRKRKAKPELRKDGRYATNPQRMGPLTMEARAYGLEMVLDIQKMTRMDLINQVEEARIRELWKLNTWPEKWSDVDIDADIPIDALMIENEKIIRQSLLI
jgi:DNA sulfur modification protein DndC